MLAVLEDAITCIQKGRRWFRETVDWIVTDDDDWLFSFNNICETLGLDPASRRLALTDLVTRRSPESYNTKPRKSQEPIEKKRDPRKDWPKCRVTQPALYGQGNGSHKEDKMNHIKDMLVVYDSKIDNRTLFEILRKQACGIGAVERGLNRLSIGIGTIPRGEVGLIFAGVGLTLSVGGERIIDEATFAAILVMVVVTTLITSVEL